MSLLATGRFISIIPNSVLRFSTRRPDLKVLPVKQPLSHMPVGIITLKNRTLSPVAQLFIDTAREIAKPLAKTK
jgi:DNA-binding transcriptional LysR family regulator